MKKEEITGVVLAGGKNSRMGSDKGLLQMNGKKMIDRILDAVSPLTGEVMIISNGNNYNDLGLAVHKDLIPDCGPMGGIFTALNYCKTKKILVVSCDMPHLSPILLEKLIREAEKADVVVPELNSGSLEPLCAIYSTSCFNTFATLLHSGQWKMRDALSKFNILRVPADAEKRSFHNINTPAEYQSLLNFEHDHTH